MRVLVLSNTPWDNNNSFGNTYSNIFSGMDDLEFVNIYCRSGNPNTSIELKCFQITTGAMLKSILYRENVVTGHEVKQQNLDGELLSKHDSDIYNFARNKRWILLFWVRELIWKIGRWNSKELKDFLDAYKPDIIFQPIYGQGYAYLNRMALFIKAYTGVPMFGYVSDDCYSYRQFSVSPLYWIDRIIRHDLLKKVIESCSVLYVVSDIQKKEYEKMLNVTCKVMTKGITNNRNSQSNGLHSPLRFIFAGNIGEGRWKTLVHLGRALNRIAKGKAILRIYTRTPITNRIKKQLTLDSVQLMGSVDSDQIMELYNESDILVHVESFNLRQRLSVHQSFSTKLVDYFSMGKCIFAVGPKDVASISHLINYDAAIVATSKEEIFEKLNTMISNPSIMSEYCKKSYQCGIERHQLSDFQEMLRTDFYSALK